MVSSCANPISSLRPSREADKISYHKDKRIRRVTMAVVASARQPSSPLAPAGLAGSFSVLLQDAFCCRCSFIAFSPIPLALRR